MVKLILGLGMMSLFVGCKSSQKAPQKVQPVSAFGPEDDGAIDVPKELEDKISLTQSPSLSSRSRLRNENVSKDLKAGSKLSVKVRSMKSLQLDIFAKNLAQKVSLPLIGSTVPILDLKSPMNSLEIPVKSMGEELTEVSIPKGTDYGFQITQLVPKDGGEIISWKILNR